MRQIRDAISAATINPDLLTAAERLQYDGYLRREEENTAILRLAKERVPIKEIVRRTGYSRGMVRKVLRGQRPDVFRVRESSLELYLPWLDAQWAAGRRNGSELWRQIPRLPACGQRVGGSPTTLGKSRWRSLEPHAVRMDDRAAPDDRPRRSYKI